MPYAEATKVPTTQSRDEIEKTLQRYGATAFAYGWNDSLATVQFDASVRRVRIMLPLPDEEEFAKTPGGQRRSKDARRKAHAQAVRSRWRALLLIIKAKLEAVESGVTTFEEEFLPHIVLPSGETVGQNVLPKVAEAYETGQMPELLAGTRQLPSGA
jgi:hypothetical protein